MAVHREEEKFKEVVGIYMRERRGFEVKGRTRCRKMN